MRGTTVQNAGVPNVVNTQDSQEQAPFTSTVTVSSPTCTRRGSRPLEGRIGGRIEISSVRVAKQGLTGRVEPYLRAARVSSIGAAASAAACVPRAFASDRDSLR
eukprot:4911083-Pyramimonas_sp.AAC.1